MPLVLSVVFGEIERLSLSDNKSGDVYRKCDRGKFGQTIPLFFSGAPIIFSARMYVAALLKRAAFSCHLDAHLSVPCTQKGFASDSVWPLVATSSHWKKYGLIPWLS